MKEKEKKNAWHYIQITERDSKVMEFLSDTQLFFFNRVEYVWGFERNIIVSTANVSRNWKRIIVVSTLVA